MATVSRTIRGGYKVCYSPDRARAISTAHALWPNEALPGELAQALSSPVHFEQAGSLVTKDMIADAITCGDDVDAHVEAFRPFVEAGFDVIHISQIGAARQDTNAVGFFEFYADVLPRLRSEYDSRAGGV